MKVNLTLTDHFRETRLFMNRLIASIVVIGILILVLIARMFYLQIINHAHYDALSTNNRVNVVPIVPTRGLIFDRNGVVLAENLPSFSLEVVPERVENMDATLDELRKLVTLTDGDIKRFKSQLKRQRRFSNIPLRFRLNDEEVARFGVNRHRFPGVDIEARLMRHYPLQNVAVHAIGYVGRISESELQALDATEYSGSNHIGKVGVEKFYEDILHGSVGFQKVETNAQGRTLRVLEENYPTPGKNLYLNIDIGLQQTAEKALGNNRGAIVALNPKDGSILAFVSMPTFDPNPFVNGIDNDEYKALTQSEDQPLFNRALRGQYPPGSTTKPFLALAGLESNQIEASTPTHCSGAFTLKNDDRKYRDWKKSGHGEVTMDDAIVQSCDVYFYELALTLGIDQISKFMSGFGFGQRTGIDITGELPGLMPSREWKRQNYNQPWFPGETLITGIGQGSVLATPVQLATITANLANRGKRLQPRIVGKIQDPTSGVVDTLTGQEMEPVMLNKPSHWNIISRAMTRVVHSPLGTARSINHNLKYRVAGKTGTSQVFGIKQNEEYVVEDIPMKLRDHALFIAYAPVEDPQIAIAIIIENGGGGGAVAAPIARIVMDHYLNKEPS